MPHDRGETAGLVMIGFIIGSLTIAGVFPWDKIYYAILGLFR